MCFGCGPKNDNGLQLKSFVAGELLLATFQPKPHHQAFEGMLNGGIIGALLDCHCNWRAAWELKNLNEVEIPPCCVTAEYTIKLHAPTPLDQPVHLKAWIEKAKRRHAVVRGELSSGDELTAECRGVFVAVKPGHPAYHRW
jgi:acyl-coenzyme A thioesterase PaaI-like protein